MKNWLLSKGKEKEYSCLASEGSRWHGQSTGHLDGTGAHVADRCNLSVNTSYQLFGDALVQLSSPVPSTLDVEHDEVV